MFLRTVLKNEIRDRAIHPEDRSKDTLKSKLMKLMTSIESTIKRYTSEFIYTLCDHDGKSLVLRHWYEVQRVPVIADEFARRTGLGNAIALLRTKGIM